MTKAARTPRHWFQFSLTMWFVVLTVFAGWLGWQRHAVRQRQALIEWVVERNGRIRKWGSSTESCARSAPDFEAKRQSFPRWRQHFGDEPILYISVIGCGATWEQRERMASWFPEAYVVPEQPSGL